MLTWKAEIATFATIPFLLLLSSGIATKRGFNGLCQACKECANERSRKWHQDNRDYARQRARDYDAKTRKPGSRRAAERVNKSETQLGIV
jgi:hypothetical protein